MPAKKKIIAICGSTRSHSSNLHIIKKVAALTAAHLDMEIIENLAEMPHFNPGLDNEQVPAIVAQFREKINTADGVLICTPEYVFSLPGSLKNILEWTVSTVVFSDKPLAIITASASGEKAHESIQLIMKTLGAKFNDDTTLLIQSPKSKVNNDGEITDEKTLQQLEYLSASFLSLLSGK